MVSTQPHQDHFPGSGQVGDLRRLLYSPSHPDTYLENIMKKLFKILGAILVAICFVVIVFSAWYVIKFWPRHAEDMEFGNPEFNERVLIATQGSEFKNDVVQRLAEKLSARDIYIKITDVSNLDSIDSDAWADIVILNSNIADKMNTSVRTFLNRVGPSDSIIVITTSGWGDFVPPNLEVDGITTASRLNETEKMANRIFHAL